MIRCQCELFILCVCLTKRTIHINLSIYMLFIYLARFLVRLANLYVNRRVRFQLFGFMNTRKCSNAFFFVVFFQLMLS